jgi:hypothetical protein
MLFCYAGNPGGGPGDDQLLGPGLRHPGYAVPAQAAHRQEPRPAGPDLFQEAPLEVSFEPHPRSQKPGEVWGFRPILFLFLLVGPVCLTHLSWRNPSRRCLFKARFLLDVQVGSNVEFVENPVS